MFVMAWAVVRATLADTRLVEIKTRVGVGVSVDGGCHVVLVPDTVVLWGSHMKLPVCCGRLTHCPEAAYLLDQRTERLTE